MTPFEEQGLFGELIVKTYYENLGYIVIKNPNQYGPWDLFAYNDFEAFTIQVKTCVRYVKYNYISLHQSATNDSFISAKFCDKLIFVIKDPEAFDDNKYGGNVYEAIDHKKHFSINEFKIPCNSSTLKLLTSLSQDERAKLKSFKTSK